VLFISLSFFLLLIFFFIFLLFFFFDLFFLLFSSRKSHVSQGFSFLFLPLVFCTPHQSIFYTTIMPFFSKNKNQTKHFLEND